MVHKLSKKQILIDSIFKPNENGESIWVNREVLQLTDLNWGNNGIGRHGTYWGDDRYIWEKEPKTGGRITSLRLAGHSNSKFNSLNRPIRKDIKDYFKNKENKDLNLK